MKGVKDITNNPRTLKETVDNYVQLTLKRANIMDAGTYFIVARNVYGCDRAFVTVRVSKWKLELIDFVWYFSEKFITKYTAAIIVY